MNLTTLIQKKETLIASVEAIRDSLTAAVKRQLMSDVPYGVLLSGGLDSSVISALAEKFSEHRIEDNSKTRAYWPRLHSFAVGLKGAPDLAKARRRETLPTPVFLG